MNLSFTPLNINRPSAALPTRSSSVVTPPNHGAAIDFGPAYAVNLSAQGKEAAAQTKQDPNVDALDPSGDTKKANGAECQTCKSRKYQDGSNDANVSFKTPGHISPESSASVVAAHEQEHVNNAQAEDQKANKELVSSNVRLYTSICPECGRSYTAGGETTTVMKTTNEEKANKKDLLGQNVDIAA